MVKLNKLIDETGEFHFLNASCCSVNKSAFAFRGSEDFLERISNWIYNHCDVSWAKIRDFGNTNIRYIYLSRERLFDALLSYYRMELIATKEYHKLPSFKREAVEWEENGEIIKGWDEEYLAEDFEAAAEIKAKEFWGKKIKENEFRIVLNTVEMSEYSISSGILNRVA